MTQIIDEAIAPDDFTKALQKSGWKRRKTSPDGGLAMWMLYTLGRNHVIFQPLDINSQEYKPLMAEAVPVFNSVVEAIAIENLIEQLSSLTEALMILQHSPNGGKRVVEYRMERLLKEIEKASKLLGFNSVRINMNKIQEEG